MKIAEHLKELHTHHAAHFLARAKHHVAMHSHIISLADSLNKAKSDMDGKEEAGDGLRAMADLHKAMSEECASMGEYHAQAAKNFGSTGKAMMGGGDLARLLDLEPTEVSAIAPDAPGRLVLRAGMREFTKADVPPEFQKLVDD